MQQARQAMRSKNGFVNGVKLRLNYKIIGGAEINRGKIGLAENGIQQIAFVKYRTAEVGLRKGGFF